MNADRFDTLLAALTAAPSRRAALRGLAGLGLAGLVSQTDAKKKHRKKKKKKCAKAGQRPGKKRKRCCQGLVTDGSGICAQPVSDCVTSTCDPNTCGSVPDGCGGTLSCGCPTNQLCLRSGACQPCTVTCTGTPAVCGTALQTAMNGGGTVYVCPGRYQGGFTLSNAVTVIGAGEGTDAASNTILDANDVGRVLTILTGIGPIELERLRITGGNTNPGAGILHQGATLRMMECTVSGNIAVSSFALGGGIAVDGQSTLEMTRCTVRNNHANATFGQQNSAQGGGMYVAGTTTLTDCLVERNHASVEGGGLFVISPGVAILAGDTQVRDNAADFGGGILAAGTLEIAETCRVTENTADGPGNGGGIRYFQGTVTLAGGDPSPIVVNNCHENCAPMGTVPNCAPTPVSC